MATINFAGNSYAGEVLEDLLVYTAQGNDTFKEGLVHIQPGIQAKYTLPHVSLGKIIQDNVPTPTSTMGAEGTDGSNQYTFAERYLEPQDFMVYLEFNPRHYEKFWRPFQPTGPLVFRELDPKVQSKMLHLLVDKKDQYIDDCIWGSRKGGSDTTKVTSPTGATVLGGDCAAGKMKYFDGAVMRVLNNLSTSADSNEKASGKVVLAGDTELTTGAQVEAALYAMWKACPKNLRKSDKLKFVMSWELWDLYDEYLTKKDVKYVDNSQVNRRTFKGKPIVIVNGMTEHTIFLGKFSRDMDSCLWMGVDYATDFDSIKVEQLQNNSELYFFQMRMKADVNIVLPSEIIVWTAYKNAAASAGGGVTPPVGG